MASEDPMRGTDFRVIARLGHGGMGDVFEIEHKTKRQRLVAKIMHKELAEDASTVDRMRLEGQALAELSSRSEHLVNVFGLGLTVDRRPYLLMERLVGSALDAELEERGPFGVHEAVNLTIQVLEALGVVHAAGIVHRDVKPENLFLCAPIAGRRLLKLLDFGIAKVLDTPARSSQVAPLAVATTEGLTIGSPRWLSPEQVRGKPVSPQSDLYSVGLVLYTLLAGKNPFLAATELHELLDMHETLVPPPPSIARARAIGGSEVISEALDRVVMRAIAKEPSGRFPSAVAFASELVTIARAHAVVAWAPTEELRPLRVLSPSIRPQTVVELASTETVTLTKRAPAVLPWKVVVPLVCVALVVSIGVTLLLRWLLGSG